jgi:HK97 gp10 family phage protein
MALESYIKLENKEEVIASLIALQGDVQSKVFEGLAAAGKEVKADLKQSLRDSPGSETRSSPGSTPLNQTGELRAEIYSAMRKPMQGQPITLSIFVRGNVFYARMLEFGTSKMAARPWFYATIHKKFPMLKNVIADSLAKVVEYRNRLRGKYIRRGRMDSSMASALGQQDLQKLADFKNL